jgi:hypothetical protein
VIATTLSGIVYQTGENLLEMGGLILQKHYRETPRGFSSKVHPEKKLTTTDI